MFKVWCGGGGGFEGIREVKFIFVNKQKWQNMSEIRYIPDKEVNLLELDLLGSLVYVETIQKIIENCETPYTIGLFGSWGSGKSSIIKTIKENLNNDKSKKVKVFYYDAWKYSKDDFRRTFILELRKSFNLDTKEEEELFYKDKVEDVQFKPKFDKWSIIIFILVLIISYRFYGIEIRTVRISNIVFYSLYHNQINYHLSSCSHYNFKIIRA
jgi:Cdc6-like AAA superfamily ATPase